MRSSLAMRRFPAASLDLLWVCVPLALIWLFVALTPMPPNDLWWHMAAGRMMVDEGRIIAENRWSYTLPADAPYVFQSWLSEIIMYGTWQLGGVPMLALLRLLAISSAYALVGWYALRRANGRAVALALLVTALVGWNNWTLRPQTLAMPVGAAFLVLLGEYLDGRLPRRWLALLPALMLLWVNLHGSFILGLGLLGAACVAAFVEKRPGDRSLWLALGGTIVAALLNPLGIGIVGYLRTMLGNSVNQSMIVEWQPPEPSFDLAGFGFWFYAMLLGLALIMALGSERPRLAELLWYCGLAWLALNGLRYVMWFGLLLAPLLARRIALLLPPAEPTRSTFAFVLVILLATSAIFGLPWFNPASALGLERQSFYAPSGPDRLLLGADTPREAADWLAANPIEGRIWVDMAVSSYLVWAIPDLKVFTDQRVELFPKQTWDDAFAIVKGDQTSLELLDQWQISYVLLHRHWQRTLLARLETTPGWCKPYEDQLFTILKRC